MSGAGPTDPTAGHWRAAPEIRQQELRLKGLSGPSEMAARARRRGVPLKTQMEVDPCHTT